MQEVDLNELARFESQKKIDSRKLRTDRNRMGQFSTPKQLATEMLAFARLVRDNSPVRFLDPALGTGTFFSALLNTFDQAIIDRSVGYEIDQDYANAAKHLWNKYDLRVYDLDFLKATSPISDSQKFNLIICNPPYVRNQHIKPEDKITISSITSRATGIKLSGLSGLYCYFLLACHTWMSKKAIAGWLIPSEFMDVNYGKFLKEYLLTKVTVLRIHRFDPTEVQFDDALVSSAIIWLKNEPPPYNHEIEFTYGGTLLTPTMSVKLSIDKLQQIAKWSKLAASTTEFAHTNKQLKDFFIIKRGIATGANNFFIMPEDTAAKLKIPFNQVQPILPSPKNLNIEKVEADSTGNPLIEKRLVVLSSKLSEGKIKREYPDLWSYLEKGIAEAINERYICKHRNPWYSQEYRMPAPFLFNIIGRVTNENRKPYRFILNNSRAIASNNYLMLYPKANLNDIIGKNLTIREEVWQALNEITINELLANGRVYGGDMHKLEPKELGNVAGDSLERIIAKYSRNKRVCDY